MLIDIERLAAEGLRFDEALRLPDLPVDGAEPLRVLQLRVRGTARRGRRGVDLVAELATRLRIQCCRCLEPYEHDLDCRFRLVLVPEAVEFGVGESELDPDAALLFYATGGKVDLRHVAREQIYLNLPLKPVCRLDCRGLCPTCGANRNRLECACQSEELDPRLAPLLEFKKRWGSS